MKKKQILTLSLYILTSLFFIVLAWKNFITNCPNKEFLTWDPELRYIFTLELLDSLRNGEILRFFLLILDTPTWPPLRNLIQLLVFGIFKHSPILDVWLTVFTFFILGLSLFLISNHKKIIFFFSFGFSLLVFLSPALLLYAFSGMLEIQGGLFLVLSSFYFGVFLIKKIPSKKNIFLLFLCTFALYFTKYPYGYLFAFSCLCILLLFYFKNFLLIIKSYIRQNFFSHIPIFIGVVITIVFLLLGDQWKTGKATKYFKFTLANLIFLEFLIFFFSNQKKIFSLFPKFYYVCFTIFFPIGFWSLSHPDRFGSSQGTLQHIQVDGFHVGEVVTKDFYYYLHLPKVLFIEVWLYPFIGMTLCVITIFSLSWGLYVYIQKKQIRLHFIFSLILLFSLFILIFFTSNHQGRHVYHFIPLLLLIPLFVVKEEKNLKNLFSFFLGSFFIIIIFLIIYKNINWLNSSYLCFSGVGKLYEVPKFFESKATEIIDQDFFFYNAIEEGHLHRANSEYVLKKYAYDNKLKMYTKKQDLKSKKLLLIVVSRNCLKDNLPFEIAFSYRLISQHPTTDGCIEKWEPILHEME